jgi:hypothetical protein
MFNIAGSCSKVNGRLILYYNKPITVCINISYVKHPSKAFYKFEDGDSTVSERFSLEACGEAPTALDHIDLGHILRIDG